MRSGATGDCADVDGGTVVRGEDDGTFVELSLAVMPVFEEASLNALTAWVRPSAVPALDTEKEIVWIVPTLPVLLEVNTWSDKPAGSGEIERRQGAGGGAHAGVGFGVDRGGDIAGAVAGSGGDGGRAARTVHGEATVGGDCCTGGCRGCVAAGNGIGNAGIADLIGTVLVGAEVGGGCR